LLADATQLPYGLQRILKSADGLGVFGAGHAGSDAKIARVR
jgi:hypothetical protein